MESKIIESNEVPKFIVDTLHSVSTKLEKINNGKYHHNRKYKTTPLVCKYGILSLSDQNKLGLRNDSKEFLKKMDDDSSHINGIEEVSLSVVGLTDLYKDEEEYDPYKPEFVDFIISNDIFAFRKTKNYGNEYVTQSIDLKNILTLDFRLLDYIKTKKQVSPEELIEMYNNLLKASKIIKKSKSGILLREMSQQDPFNIDIDKFSQSKKLILKKE